MVYAALVSLSHTIHQILNHNQFSVSLHHNQQITSLHEYTYFLKVFFENFPGKGNSVVGRIRDLTYQAEDMIEYFMLEQIRLRHGLIESNTGARNVHSGYDSSELEKVTNEIEAIAEEVMDIKNNTSARIKEEHSGNDDSPAVSSSSRLASSRQKDVIVDFNDDLLAIQERLCGDSSNRQVIPIVGMGGIGKTTLARNAYHDPLIIESFHIRAWVTVSQDYSTHDILSRLLVSITGERSEQGNGSMEENVYRSLKGKRYLIVLDDIWSKEVWDDLNMLFPNDNNGSRIILTTRLLTVAAYPDSSSSLHEMHPMDEHQSWDLLQQKVFERGDCPLELEYIGMKIARSCGGLPLSIVVIAGLLSVLSKTRASWNEIAENVKNSAIATNDGRMEKVLSLSYTNLPHHLRSCFLYMGAFPEDYEINVSKLIKLWLAEGFVEAGESKNMEEMAEEYLEDLVKRSLVLVSKTKSNGKIKSCSLHDIIRELCIKTGQQEKFLFHVIDRQVSSESIGNQRRVCITKSDHLYSLADIYGSANRTIICIRPIAVSVRRFGNFKFLRVLDFESADFTERERVDRWDLGFEYVERVVRSLPTQLFELFHLRFLAFGYPMSIPAAISKLENLQTLIIHPRKTDWGLQPCIVSLPKEVWRMTQLRHLSCLYFKQSPNPEEGSASTLENLQTLSGVRDLVCSESIMKMFPNVKELGLLYNSDANGKDYHLENLVHLQQLEKLKLVAWPYSTKVKVNPTLPLTLRKLTLSGWLVPLPHMMTTLGSLPNLEVLKIRKSPLDWIQWETSEGEFLSLKYLLIEDSSLEQWITESSHFPSLKSLILHDCWDMFDIPDGIGEVATLELIEVRRGNNFIYESALRIQEEQRSWGNDVLQVRQNYHG